MRRAAPQRLLRVVINLLDILEIPKTDGMHGKPGHVADYTKVLKCS